MSKFTHLLTEILGARMEAHVQPDVGAREVPLVPTMSYLAAAAQANAGLAPTTGVSQTTGVGSTRYVVDLTDADDEEMETVPTKAKIEDVIMEDVTEKVETAQVTSVFSILVPHIDKE